MAFSSKFDNRLKLHDVKTNLLVLATTIQTQTRGAQVSISTPTETIRPTSSEKLLGCWINDLKWTEHNKDNPMKSLNTNNENNCSSWSENAGV